MNCWMLWAVMIKTKIKYILTFAAVMVFSGCGLYSYPYIEAPNVSKVVGGGVTECIIENASGNDPEVFRGYEIYYKFYDQNKRLAEQRDDHNAIFAKEEPDYTALLAVGYKRCRVIKNMKKDTTVPMIPIPSGFREDDFNITIDFKTLASGSNDEHAELLAEFKTMPIESIPLYRCIEDTKPESWETPGDINNVYKDFNSIDLEYEECHDSDLPTKEVSVSMYILSYGLYDNVYNLYSKPVWLGYVNCWNY